MLETTFPILSVSSDGKVKYKNGSAKAAFKMPKVNTYIHRYLDIGYDVDAIFDFAKNSGNVYDFLAMDIPGNYFNSLCSNVWDDKTLLMLMLPFIQQNTSTILWRTFRPIVLSIAAEIFDIVLTSDSDVDDDFYCKFLNRSGQELSMTTASSVHYLYDKALAYGPYDIEQILDIFTACVSRRCRDLRYSVDILLDKSYSGINREVEHPFFTLIFLETLLLSLKCGAFEHADIILSLEYGRVSAKMTLHSKRSFDAGDYKNAAGTIGLLGKINSDIAVDAAICALFAKQLDVEIKSSISESNAVTFEAAMPLAALSLPVRSHTLYPNFANDLRLMLEAMVS